MMVTRQQKKRMAASYAAWEGLSREELCAMHPAEFLPAQKQAGFTHTYTFFDRRGNPAGQVIFSLDARDRAMNIREIAAARAGTGAGSNIIRGLKAWSDAWGVKLTVSDAEEHALPYWRKMGFRIEGELNARTRMIGRGVAYYPGGEG